MRRVIHVDVGVQPAHRCRGIDDGESGVIVVMGNGLRTLNHSLFATSHNACLVTRRWLLLQPI